MEVFGWSAVGKVHVALMIVEITVHDKSVTHAEAPASRKVCLEVGFIALRQGPCSSTFNSYSGAFYRQISIELKANRTVQTARNSGEVPLKGEMCS